MRNTVQRLHALLLYLFLAIFTLGWTGNPTDTTVRVEYDEPTTNTDGSLLNDLLKTVMIWKIGSGIETSVDVSATRPQGGGHIIRNINVTVAPNQRGLLSVQLIAVDTSNTPSARSASVTLDIDRKPPAVPTNFRVTK